MRFSRVVSKVRRVALECITLYGPVSQILLAHSYELVFCVESKFLNVKRRDLFQLNRVVLDQQQSVTIQIVECAD